MSIKIIIADDHKIMREGLHTLLEKHQNFEIVAESGDGRSTARLVQELSPDVVVMDVVMPDLNGIEATRKIVAENPNVKIIALSMHSDNQFIIEMLKAGASGYLLKECAFEELVQAINSVADGQFYLSPKISTVVLKDYIKTLQIQDARSSVFSILSDREREVIQLIAEGKTTKSISSRLNVSVKTVETHRHQIMKKLNIHSIAELTKYAVREGLTSLES